MWEASTLGKKPPGKQKKKSKKTWLKVIIWLVVIAAIVFLTLYLSAKIGQFDSIPDLLDYIKAQVTKS